MNLAEGGSTAIPLLPPRDSRLTGAGVRDGRESASLVSRVPSPQNINDTCKTSKRSEAAPVQSLASGGSLRSQEVSPRPRTAPHTPVRAPTLWGTEPGSTSRKPTREEQPGRPGAAARGPRTQSEEVPAGPKAPEAGDREKRIPPSPASLRERKIATRGRELWRTSRARHTRGQKETPPLRGKRENGSVRTAAGEQGVVGCTQAGDRWVGGGSRWRRGRSAGQTSGRARRAPSQSCRVRRILAPGDRQLPNPFPGAEKGRLCRLTCFPPPAGQSGRGLPGKRTPRPLSLMDWIQVGLNQGLSLWKTQEPFPKGGGLPGGRPSPRSPRKACVCP